MCVWLFVVQWMVHCTLQPVSVRLGPELTLEHCRQWVGFTKPQVRLGGWQFKTNQLSVMCGVGKSKTCCLQPPHLWIWNSWICDCVFILGMNQSTFSIPIIYLQSTLSYSFFIYWCPVQAANEVSGSQSWSNAGDSNWLPFSQSCSGPIFLCLL